MKNGDRWAVRAVRPDGALDVNFATRRQVRLPAGYVTEHVALGYAATVHGAQGLTADVCPTVATGAESRQLLYVAMTRGRRGNHLYLTTAAGGGDPHSVITRDALLPPTAVDVLTAVLRYDGAQTSAATTSRNLADPRQGLQPTADRYHDAVTTAAPLHLGPD